MTEAELLDLIAREEDQAVECKAAVLSRREIAEYAVGIGNAAGGWLIMGVSDRRPRKILSARMPSEEELTRIRHSVAESAGVHLNLDVVDTSRGPVLVAGIPGRPRGVPLHTRDGKYLIRLGEQLRGMTVTELDVIRAEAGIELTAHPIDEPPASVISAAGLEELRRIMTETEAAPDLQRLSDTDLLRALGVLTDEGQLLVAGLLLVGKPEAIRARLPRAEWQFLRMIRDTDYDLAERGHDCFAIALRRMRELVNANNPITTIMYDLVHAEYPRYPTIAMRELLTNALAHRDYEGPSTVMVKLHRDRLEITNPGGLIGGVTPGNILHHPSVARYPTLFQALTRMRLANASNLGVARVFRDFLREGKQPPSYSGDEHFVRVTVRGQEARREFVDFVKDRPDLDVDELLVLHHLTLNREITPGKTAEVCQRPVDDVQGILERLASERGLLEPKPAAGARGGEVFRLGPRAREALGPLLEPLIDRRERAAAAREKVMAALRERPLSNAELRALTGLTRYPAARLMAGLREEGLVRLEGARRGARWVIAERT